MSECAELRAAIARLEAKIDGLGKIDEQSIIDKAVQQAGQLFDPKFAAIGLVASGAAAEATEAAAKAGRFAGVAASLGKLIPIAGTLVALAGSAGTIKLLETRSDGLEKQIDSVGKDLSKALGSLNKTNEAVKHIRGTANNALIKADRGLKKNSALESRVQSFDKTIKHVRGTANDALIVARRAIEKFPLVESTIEHVRGTANDGLIVARRAEARIETVASQFESQGQRFDH
jgi:hypothetical protein